MIYFKEPYVTVSWDEEIQAVILQWQGFISLPKIQTGLNKALELFEQKGQSNWLADTSQLSPVSKEIDQWVNEEWVPRAIVAGIKNMAMVIPKSALARMGIEASMSKAPTDNEVTMAFFDSQLSAKRWLRSR